MKCKYCGHENREGISYCEECGKKLMNEDLQSDILYDSSLIHKISRAKDTKLFYIVICGFLVLSISLCIGLIYFPTTVHAEYRDLIKKGQEYLEAHEYEKAEDCFLDAIEIEPKEKEAYQELKDLYEATGQNKKSAILQNWEDDIQISTSTSNSNNTNQDDPGPNQEELPLLQEDVDLFIDMVTQNSSVWNPGSLNEEDEEERYQSAVEHLYDADFKCGLYNYFFEDSVVATQSKSDDEVYQMDADKADWILENILNMEVDHDYEDSNYYYSEDVLCYSNQEDDSKQYLYQILDVQEIDENQYLFSLFESAQRGVGASEFSLIQDSKVLYFLTELREDDAQGKYWSILNYSSLESEYDAKEENILSTRATKSVQAFDHYLEKVVNHQEDEEDVFGIYYLYDIDQNEMNELVLHQGTCEADAMYTIYTFEDELYNLGQTGASHSVLQKAPDEIGVYRNSAHMGGQRIDLIQIEDKEIVETNILSEEVLDGKEYTNYVSITYYEVMDLTGFFEWANSLNESSGFTTKEVEVELPQIGTEITQDDSSNNEVTPEMLIGEWTIDSKITYDQTGKDMMDLFGTSFRYGNQMTFSDDGSFLFYAGATKGEGTWELVDGIIKYNYSQDSLWNGEGTIEYLHIDGQDVLKMPLFDDDGMDVYWVKDN